ncbi:phosphoserine phosphatase [Entomortierella parvispora]|uniref:phosphoserine phosphatase n=1 Tax=Entomortierella parvispora TaxID=205924 RepID=A0A9P3H9G1_9FUNG|nr:phosphoserine phosphatase [Entomortierella parvispora]
MKYGNYLRERKTQLPAEWQKVFIDYQGLKDYIKTNIAPACLKPTLASASAFPPGSQTATPVVPGATNAGLQASLLPASGLMADVDLQEFSTMIAHRLTVLQTAVPEFLARLDSQVTEVSAFTTLQTRKIYEAYGAFQGGQVGLGLVSSQSNTHHEDIHSTPVANSSTDKATPASAQDDNSLESLLQSVIKLEKYIFLNYTGIVKIIKKMDRHAGLGISGAYLGRVWKLPFARAEQLSSLKKELMEKLSGVMTRVTVNTETAIGRPALDAPFSPLALNFKSDSPVMMWKPTALAPTEKTWFPPAALLPHQRVLISMSGPHGTDIIGTLLACAAKYQCEVEDFSFARLYHNVTFAILITIKNDDMDIFKDLAAAAKRWDATLTFDILDSLKKDPHFGNYVPRSLEDAPYEGRLKYTATVLCQHGLTSAFLSDWTHLLLVNKISVEKMVRLNEGQLSCADYKLSIPANLSMDKFREELFQLSADHGTDVALQPYDVFRKHKRLVVFDMDSTLIQQEVIDEIARHAGVMEKVSEITEAAMNGEIDFKESLKRRVALLKGTPVSVLETVREQLTFTEDALYLCKALKKIGFKLAVISGGFMPLALHVKNILGLDYAFANQLKVSPDGLYLTGETVGPIVSGERKAELLEVIAQAESVTLDQVIAVGDGANDLWMLAKAGLGIAFNAKPRVQQKARARINQKSLKYVLYLLGYEDAEIRQLATSS